MSFIAELIVIGFVVTIIGVPLSYLAMRIERKDIYLSFASWVRIAITFFLTGVLAHLLFEWSGMNKKYCKIGNACKNILRV